MLDEKTMVADTLAGINGELVRYGEMIPQTENMQLKQVLKQFRNQCETSQEEIYQLAYWYHRTAISSTKQLTERFSVTIINI